MRPLINKVLAALQDGLAVFAIHRLELVQDEARLAAVIEARVLGAYGASGT